MLTKRLLVNTHTVFFHYARTCFIPQQAHINPQTKNRREKQPASSHRQYNLNRRNTAFASPPSFDNTTTRQLKSVPSVAQRHHRLLSTPNKAVYAVATYQNKPTVDSVPLDKASTSHTPQPGPPSLIFSPLIPSLDVYHSQSFPNHTNNTRHCAPFPSISTTPNVTARCATW